MDRVGGKAAGGGGERIAYVDAARGLAILCVVLGHLYPGDGIVQYISSFHVPVFFILSGLLMAARDGWKTRRLTEFAAKKAKRLLYPYATISALNLALIFARWIWRWFSRAGGRRRCCASSPRRSLARGLTRSGFYRRCFWRKSRSKSWWAASAGGWESPRSCAWRSERRGSVTWGWARCSGKGWRSSLVWPTSSAARWSAASWSAWATAMAASGRAFGSRGRRSMGWWPPRSRWIWRCSGLTRWICIIPSSATPRCITPTLPPGHTRWWSSASWLSPKTVSSASGAGTRPWCLRRTWISGFWKSRRPWPRRRCMGGASRRSSRSRCSSRRRWFLRSTDTQRGLWIATRRGKRSGETDKDKL